MIEGDLLIRAGAVVAGVAGLAGPYLVAAAKTLRLPTLGGGSSKESDLLKDAHTVLEIANRLKAEGMTDGVALCQQLIDVMLRPKAEKKA